MVPQVSRPGFVTLRRLLVAGVVIATGLGAGAMPAGATSSSGLSIDSITVGLGSGIVTQTINIAPGSPIIGSSGEIDIWGTEGATYIRGITAGASTRASCRSGVSIGIAGLTWGFTCTPAAAGWIAGSLGIQVDSGSPSSPGVCALVISCGFSTYAGWVGPGGPEVSGAVELTHEADLSVTLNNQAPANSINILGHSNGPSLVSRAVITVTGLGNYTVSNVDGQCTQAGSTLICSSQLGSGANMAMQPVFSGGSGPLSLHASIAGYFEPFQNQTVSMPDPNSGNNTSNLTWTPGAGSSGGSGSGGGKPGASAASISPSTGASGSAVASVSSSTSAFASPSGADSAASPSATLGTGSTPLDAAPVAHSTGSSLTPLWVVLGVLMFVAAGGGGLALLRKRRTD